MNNIDTINNNMLQHIWNRNHCNWYNTLPSGQRPPFQNSTGQVVYVILHVQRYITEFHWTSVIRHISEFHWTSFIRYITCSFHNHRHFSFHWNIILVGCWNDSRQRTWAMVDSLKFNSQIWDWGLKFALFIVNIIANTVH